MNKERARAWVRALRSGEYPQGTGGLKVDGKFCCLGVLCHTLELEGVLKSRLTAGGYATAWGESAGYVPGDDVAKLMELEHANVDVMYNGQRTKLWVLNDQYKLSFNQIADLIEKEYDL